MGSLQSLATQEQQSWYVSCHILQSLINKQNQCTDSSEKSFKPSLNNLHLSLFRTIHPHPSNSYFKRLKALMVI